MFKSDPTFDYIFRELPRSYFLKIVELRKKRRTENPNLGLGDML